MKITVNPGRKSVGETAALLSECLDSRGGVTRDIDLEGKWWQFSGLLVLLFITPRLRMPDKMYFVTLVITR